MAAILVSDTLAVLYDVLRAPEYFRSVGDVPDQRIDEAIRLLRSKQQPDGTWLLENTHPGKVHPYRKCHRGRVAQESTTSRLNFSCRQLPKTRRVTSLHGAWRSL